MTADDVGTRPRRWRGQEPDSRTRDRREKLVAAGYDLLARDGAAAVTMRGVCRQAGLTERYFYESFADRAAFLRAVLEQVVGEAHAVVAGAVAAATPDSLLTDVVTAFTVFLDADPRRAVVLFDEALTTPDLARPGLALVQRFVDLIEQGFTASGRVDPHADAVDRSLNAMAAFGVLSRLFAARSAGRIVVDEQRFVAHVVDVLGRVAGATTAR